MMNVILEPSLSFLAADLRAVWISRSLALALDSE